MKIKTSELSGAALNWAVAECEGLLDRLVIINNRNSKAMEVWWRELVSVSHPYINNDGSPRYLMGDQPVGLFGNPAEISYSTDWALGGPIIERKRIEVKQPRPNPTAEPYRAYIPAWPKGGMVEKHHASGKTYLEAAMRCCVITELGPVIEIPEEFTQS